jgi:hypothetical protein
MIRRPARGPRRDEGSAIVEFLIIGVGVLVPMVYIVQCAMTVHAAALASTQAVREAGRAFSTSASEAQGRQRAAIAGRLAFADQGMALPPDGLRITCPDGPCLAPGSVAEITLDWRVPLPWLPASWTGRGRGAIPISAVQRVPIDDYRGSPIGSGA